MKQVFLAAKLPPQDFLFFVFFLKARTDTWIRVQR